MECSAAAAAAGNVRRRGLVAFLLLLLTAGTVRGQDAELAWARAFEPEQITENSRFTMELIIDYPDASQVSVTAPALPPGITLLGGPDIRPFRETGFGDLVRTKTRIVYVFRSGGAGWRELGSYEITAGDLRVSTDPLLLPIVARDTGTVPHDVRWSALRDTVYRGQTIPLVLQMDNVQEIMFPDSIRVSAPGNGVFEEVTGLGAIETREAGGQVLYRVPVTAYLYTPTSAGKAGIPAARITAQGVTRSSDPYGLTVLPLPEEVSPTGAVGRFSVTSGIDRNRAVPGEPVTVTVRVEGEGNLSFLQIPEPSADGLRPAERKEESSTMPSNGGLLGHREVHYVFLPEEAGSYRIELPSFPWLDPRTGAVRTAPGRSYRLEVISSGTDRKQLASGIPFEPGDPEQVIASRPADLYRRLPAYLGFLPGPLVFLLVLFRRRAGRGRIAVMLVILPMLIAAGSSEQDALGDLQRAERLYREGQYAQSLELYRQAEEILPDNPAVHRDLGLTAFAAGNSGEAVFALRRSLRLRPDRETRELLSWIEGESGLTRQVPSFPGGHPGSFFLLLAGSWNVTWLLFAGLLGRRNGTLVILCLLGLSLTFGSAGFLGRSLVGLSADTGVVSDGVYLKKIPLDEAADWIDLAAGTAVRIRAQSGEYLLVQTGYGIEGWIRSDTIQRE